MGGVIAGHHDIASTKHNKSAASKSGASITIFGYPIYLDSM